MRALTPQQQPGWPLSTCLSHRTPNTATFQSAISLGHLSAKSCEFLSLPLYLRRHDILLPVLSGGRRVIFPSIQSKKRCPRGATLRLCVPPLFACLLSRHCAFSALHVSTWASSDLRTLPFLIVASLSSSVIMSVLQYTLWPLPN